MQHVEIQVLSEGKRNVRCPGVGCKYHLLHLDVVNALQESPVKQEVLDRLHAMNSGSCQDRLKEMFCSSLADRSVKLLVLSSQPCPKCLVLAHRESGCNSIVCRCGCNFCFRCGCPYEEASCICHRLDNMHTGCVVFAAWLRSECSSPCEWLTETWDAEDMDFTLETWHLETWYAEAAEEMDETLVAVETSDADSAWGGDSFMFYGEMYEDMDYYYDHEDIDALCDEKGVDHDCFDGHVRKEACSVSTCKMLRRKAHRGRKAHRRLPASQHLQSQQARELAKGKKQKAKSAKKDRTRDCSFL